MGAARGRHTTQPPVFTFFQHLPCGSGGDGGRKKKILVNKEKTVAHWWCGMEWEEEKEQGGTEKVDRLIHVGHVSSRADRFLANGGRENRGMCGGKLILNYRLEMLGQFYITFQGMYVSWNAVKWQLWVVEMIPDYFNELSRQFTGWMSLSELTMTFFHTKMSWEKNALTFSRITWHFTPLISVFRSEITWNKKILLLGIQTLHKRLN